MNLNVPVWRAIPYSYCHACLYVYVNLIYPHCFQDHRKENIFKEHLSGPSQYMDERAPFGKMLSTILQSIQIFSQSIKFKFSFCQTRNLSWMR